MRYTAVFEFPEGQKPAVGKKDSWLGGELVSIQFSDALDNESPSQPLDQLPIGYIDAEQLRRWDRLRGTEFESKERCYMPWSATPFVSDITDCSLPVFANPMPIPTPTQHKSLANLNKLLVETDSEAWVYVKNFILSRPDIPPPLTPYNGPITNLNYQELTNIAKERANKEAALMYPEGELREKEAKRLAHKHFYQLTRKTV